MIRLIGKSISGGTDRSRTGSRGPTRMDMNRRGARKAKGGEKKGGRTRTEFSQKSDRNGWRVRGEGVKKRRKKQMTEK